MIVYDLSCEHGHRFEGWFGSSGDFADQKAGGLITCPQCGSPAVDKAPMAPSVGAKGNQRTEVARGKNVSNAPMTPEVAQALEKLAKAQAKALENSTWVGKDFAEQSRAMHYGEKDHAPIHGQASMKEAKDLLDEGVPVAPLPLPIAPPDDVN
ncbi:DUF1178 family protein [Aurantiacibacter gangjinensis]|uniref:Uncharacterized protein n=1 Tax=Aurantiacibacter gangjinensis TaxID=502682 RepID=A0A0G9MQD6_9SPHN|nr:DUF1178 family protein [Aurantiacibacter gangjinensis]APE28795.1 hypothetical protein BMF35_a1966 [Aurantiacibacter gangjinensis]KLE32946.1 hypothetical protein AAW01_02735 [Aurantiacibacter gangjinensis]